MQGETPESYYHNYTCYVYNIYSSVHRMRWSPKVDIDEYAVKEKERERGEREREGRERKA